MGMSTHIEGFKPPDDTYNRMKAAWDACAAANVPVPDEVEGYFEGETPDPAGVRVDLYGHKAIRKYNDGDRCAAGFEVVLADLPPDVKVLRFVNSW